MGVKVYLRKTKNYYDEVQFGEKKLRWLYETYLGRIVLKTVVANPFFSKFSGALDHRSFSKKKIEPFIEKYGIDKSEFSTMDFDSFASFFKRKLKGDKRPISMGPEDLIAPADSKLSVVNLNDHSAFFIKNREYNLSELIGNEKLAQEYSNGLCLIFRLTVDDYHRFSYIDSGKRGSTYKIKGKLHTVSQISAKGFNIYHENYRVISVLDTDHFDTLLYVEVGALLVGKINLHNKPHFKKGEEKGYFDMGGSTIVLLIKPNVVKIDEDIQNQSMLGIETKVYVGEKIGERVNHA